LKSRRHRDLAEQGVGQRRLHELLQLGTGHARTRSSVGRSRKFRVAAHAIRSISLGYLLTGNEWLLDIGN
jgi:hypothetical protein